MLIVFDDEELYRGLYKKLFPKLGIDLEVLECSSKEEMRKCLSTPEIINKTKVLIFDLSESKQEAESLNFDILEDIYKNYKSYPIPIFIHSAFAERVQDYKNFGTLFKVKKDSSSGEKIIDKIKLFYDSGFLDIFSPNGFLETQIHKQLHHAFIEQFQGVEIEKIIESIKHSSPEAFKDRTKDVFQRIAVRSLYQNLMSEKSHPDSGEISEIKINAVEHYYRRKGEFPVWTGDIFENQDGKKIIILTPRCDINNGYCRGNYLACNIDALDEKRVKSFGNEVTSLKNYIEDNPQNTGHKYRYLVPTPSFDGGRIDLTNYFIVNNSQLNRPTENAEYKYRISLSDELTNDVVRKFSSYILRGGISASELNEASFYSSVISTNT